MAYTNGSNDRMDELRFRSQQSPRNESSLLGGLVSPPRNGNRMPQQQGLTRRFTTDSGRVPTVTSLANQRSGGGGQEEYGPSVRLNFLHTNPTTINYSPITTIPSHYLYKYPQSFALISPSSEYNTDLLSHSQTYHKVQLVRTLPSNTYLSRPPFPKPFLPHRTGLQVGEFADCEEGDPCGIMTYNTCSWRRRS